MALELNQILIGGVIVGDPAARYGADEREYMVVTIINTMTKPGRDPSSPIVMRAQVDCEIPCPDRDLLARLRRGTEVMVHGRVLQDVLPEGTPGSRYRLKVLADPLHIHVLRSSLGSGVAALPLNAVTLTGTLLGDPSYRQLTATRSVSMFTLCNEFTRSLPGAPPQTIRAKIDCEAFGKMVAFSKSHLHRGTHIVIEGRLQENRWESQGEFRSKLTIEADQIQLQRMDVRMSPEAHSRFGSTPTVVSTRGIRQPTPPPQSSEPFENVPTPIPPAGR